MMRSKALKAGLGVVLLAVLAVLVNVGYRNNDIPGYHQIIKDSGDGVSDYSMVWLTSNQYYFGKIYRSDKDVIDLRDVFYLNVSQPLQAADTSDKTAATQPAISLAKLGNELHKPNDRMLINRNQVLFTESLREDSKVVAAINAYKDSKK